VIRNISERDYRQSGKFLYEILGGQENLCRRILAVSSIAAFNKNISIGQENFHGKIYCNV
jgi:hypothetical protein